VVHSSEVALLFDVARAWLRVVADASYVAMERLGNVKVQLVNSEVVTLIAVVGTFAEEAFEQVTRQVETDSDQTAELALEPVLEPALVLEPELEQQLVAEPSSHAAVVAGQQPDAVLERQDVVVASFELDVLDSFHSVDLVDLDRVVH
jgi:hypothetical protein